MGSRDFSANSQRGRDHVGSLEDPVERFAQVLKQFVRQAATSLSPNTEAANVHLGDPFASSSPTHRHRRMPLDSVLMVQSLESALSAAAPCDCGQRCDSVTEAGLYLLRLTRVLEQRVLKGVQQDTENAVDYEAGLPFCEARVEAATSSTIVGESCSDTSTIRSRGRRFTVPDTRLSQPSSTQLVNLLQTKLTASPSLTEGETVCNLLRYHAQLTLELQQSMLWCICRLNDIIATFSEEDGGIFGVLTDSRAAQVQWLFFDAIVQSVTYLHHRWGEDPACAGSAEAMGEASVLLDRLAQAAQTLRQTPRFPQLRVFESSGSGTARLSSPPFTSWPSSSHAMRSNGDASTLMSRISSQAASTAANSISECLGVGGADYPEKLIAQQLWCAQQLLSQRFPAYTPAWEVLERTRCSIESPGSPTPTTPHSDTPQHVATHLPISSPVLSVELERKWPGLHDGSSPPPCVVETQRKGGRPYDLLQEPALPSRGLTFSENRPAMEENVVLTGRSGATFSEGGLSAKSHDTLPTLPAPSLLLPAAGCALWDKFLASNNLSRTATLLAIQHVSAGSISSQPHSLPKT
ncbi:hypothetical protein JKF63_00590 [Porcisia hertigi]|uniref:Uncharacterized protein n=1 Tax=Porcisia hertigi TaxID=2761500 RepID=A0A836HTU1_9TRYP|nr:hypothetical protein JKF63_00590 [Porcisia hertigi]